MVKWVANRRQVAEKHLVPDREQAAAVKHSVAVARRSLYNWFMNQGRAQIYVRGEY